MPPLYQGSLIQHLVPTNKTLFFSLAPAIAKCALALARALRQSQEQEKRKVFFWGEKSAPPRLCGLAIFLNHAKRDDAFFQLANAPAILCFLRPKKTAGERLWIHFLLPRFCPTFLLQPSALLQLQPICTSMMMNAQATGLVFVLAFAQAAMRLMAPAGTRWASPMGETVQKSQHWPPFLCASPIDS